MTGTSCRQNSQRRASCIQKGRGYTDKIFTLCIIVEKFVEWNSSRFINYIDFVMKSADLLKTKMPGEDLLAPYAPARAES